MIAYIFKNFKSKDGLFKREINNNKIFSFADNSHLLDALLLAFRITEKSIYQTSSAELAQNIESNFKTENGRISAIGDLALPAPIIGLDNLKYISSIEQLATVLADKKWKDIAKSIFEKVENKGIENSAPTLSAALMAHILIFQDPYHALHIIDESTPLKELSNTYTKKFLLSTLSYITVENLIKGKMTGDNALYYGAAEKGTLFICTSSFCSSPISNVPALAQFLNEI